MEFRPLGAAGTTVSAFALGTMTFGAETDEDGSHAQLDRFVEAGGTFVDTADVYSRGASESIIGSWLARRGSAGDLVIATKGRFPMSESPLDAGAGRRHLLAAVDASLDRLGLDHVDLYQVHGWDAGTPIEETLETLTTIVESGRARYVGWSNTTGWQLQRIADLASFNGWAPPVTMQPQYNLLDRTIELEVMPVCLEQGIGLLPWSPLGGGWLTGKYTRDDRPTGATRLGEDPNRGVEAYDGRNVARTWDILDVVEDLAADRGVSMAQVALAWVRDRPTVSSVLLGARTVEQLEDNLDAASLTLDHDERDRLTSVSAVGLPPYPYGMVREWCGTTAWDELGTAVIDADDDGDGSEASGG